MRAIMLLVAHVPRLVGVSRTTSVLNPVIVIFAF